MKHVLFASLVLAAVLHSQHSAVAQVAPPELISSEKTHHKSVEISGDLVAFSATGDSGEVFLHDLVNGQQVSASDGLDFDSYPSLSGNRAVFRKYDGNSDSLYLCEYDRESGACAQVPIVTGKAMVFDPFIEGNQLVWTEREEVGGRFNLVYARYEGGEVESMQVLVSNLEGFADPIVFKNLVFWHEALPPSLTTALYALDLEDPFLRRIEVASSPTHSYTHVRATAHNGKVKLVWQSRSSCCLTEVELCELGPELQCENQITLAGSNDFVQGDLDMDPEFSGKRVVWTNVIDLPLLTGFPSDLFQYDLDSGVTQSLTPSDEVSHYWGVVSGNRMAMQGANPPGSTSQGVFFTSNETPGTEIYGSSSSGGKDNCPPPILIDVNRPPTFGDGGFAFQLFDAPAETLGVLLLGASAVVSPQSALGVDLLVDPMTAPFSVWGIATGAFGSADVPLPIPATLAPGSDVFAQALFQNTTTCGGGGTWSASHAIRVTPQ